MSRALVTFGVADHEPLLALALPSFERFADLHGYELEVATFPTVIRRPHSWWKVPALLAALDRHEEVLWIDSDMVIIAPTDDLPVPSYADDPSIWQALARHETNDGLVPNCGLWLVRQPMRTFLERLWRMTDHVNSPWWEQSAMCELLGYDPHTRPLTMRAPTPLHDHTYWLEPGWNVHCHDRQPADPARIMHATMMPNRLEAMAAWADLAAHAPAQGDG